MNPPSAGGPAETKGALQSEPVRKCIKTQAACARRHSLPPKSEPQIICWVRSFAVSPGRTPEPISCRSLHRPKGAPAPQPILALTKHPLGEARPKEPQRSLQNHPKTKSKPPWPAQNDLMAAPQNTPQQVARIRPKGFLAKGTLAKRYLSQELRAP